MTPTETAPNGPEKRLIADTVAVPRVGFTGTRDGMTDAQKATVADLLESIAPRWCHHGDCVGADADFHRLAHAAGSAIMLHPPSDPKLRAFLVGHDIAEEKPYLDRNRDIVAACDLLIATPKEDGERYGGGTWYTIHQARGQGKATVVVWPDGSTLIDGLDAVVERLATYTGEERDRDLDAFAEAEGKYGSDSEQFDGSGGVGAQGDDPDAPLVKDALRPTHRDGCQHGSMYCPDCDGATDD